MRKGAGREHYPFDIQLLPSTLRLRQLNRGHPHCRIVTMSQAFNNTLMHSLSGWLRRPRFIASARAVDGRLLVETLLSEKDHGTAITIAHELYAPRPLPAGATVQCQEIPC